MATKRLEVWAASPRRAPLARRGPPTPDSGDGIVVRKPGRPPCKKGRRLTSVPYINVSDDLSTSRQSSLSSLVSDSTRRPKRKTTSAGVASSGSPHSLTTFLGKPVKILPEDYMGGLGQRCSRRRLNPSSSTSPMPIYYVEDSFGFPNLEKNAPRVNAYKCEVKIPVPKVLEVKHCNDNSSRYHRSSKFKKPSHYIVESLEQDICQYDADETDHEFIQKRLVEDLGISDIDVKLFEQIMEKLESNQGDAGFTVYPCQPAANRRGLEEIWHYWKAKRSVVRVMTRHLKTSEEDRRVGGDDPYICFRSRGPKNSTAKTRNSSRKATNDKVGLYEDGLSARRLLSILKREASAIVDGKCSFSERVRSLKADFELRFSQFKCENEAPVEFRRRADSTTLFFGNDDEVNELQSSEGADDFPIGYRFANYVGSPDQTKYDHFRFTDSDHEYCHEEYEEDSFYG